MSDDGEASGAGVVVAGALVAGVSDGVAEEDGAAGGGGGVQWSRRKRRVCAGRIAVNLNIQRFILGIEFFAARRKGSDCNCNEDQAIKSVFLPHIRIVQGWHSGPASVRFWTSCAS